MDCLQKDIRHNPAIQHNRMSKNVLEIRVNHKLHYESYRNWRVKLTGRKRKQIGIFEGDSVSPPLFVIETVSINYLQEKIRRKLLINKVRENDNTTQVYGISRMGPDGWGCRIHRLLLCRGVRPPPNKCPGYDTKQSDGEAPVMLELWGMRSTSSLPSLPCPL